MAGSLPWSAEGQANADEPYIAGVGNRDRIADHVSIRQARRRFAGHGCFDADFQLRHPRCDPDGGLSAAGLDQCPAMDPGSDRAVDDIRNGRPGQNDQRQQEAEKKRPDRPIRTPCSSHF